MLLCDIMDRSGYEQLDRIEEQQTQILEEMDLIKEKLGIAIEKDDSDEEEKF